MIQYHLKIIIKWVLKAKDISSLQSQIINTLTLLNYIPWQNYNVSNKKRKFKYLHIRLKDKVKFLYTKITLAFVRIKRRSRNKKLPSNTILDHNLHFLKINLEKTNKTINRACNFRDIMNPLQTKTNLTNLTIKITKKIFMKLILNWILLLKIITIIKDIPIHCKTSAQVKNGRSNLKKPQSSLSPMKSVAKIQKPI
jgi:hypothetical protein